MEKFWTLVCENLGVSSVAIIILLTTFIQISPIKIDPWTAIKNFFMAPSKTLKEVSELKKDLQHIKDEVQAITTSDNHMKAEIEELKTQSLDVQKEMGIISQEIQDTKLEVQSLTKETKLVHDKLNSVEQNTELSNIQNARIRILRFADDISSEKTSHSKEHYIQILADIDTYEEYCFAHPEFPNKRTKISSKIIADSYAELLANHGFNDDDLT